MRSAPRAFGYLGLKLIDDTNNNGTYDAGETILDTKACPAHGDIRPGRWQWHAAGATKNLLVTVDLSNNATPA